MHTTKNGWCRFKARLLKWFYRVYALTLRTTVSGIEETEKILQNSPSGALFLLWHDSLLIAPVLEKLSKNRPFCSLISKSRDGALASDFALQFTNCSVLRVGHKERGQALRACCRLLSQGTHILITPDGPRGPRRKIKPGALFAAQKTQAPLIPVVYKASREYRLKSWDRFRIPLPFSRVHVALLPPVPLSDDATAIEKTVVDQENSL